MTLDELGARLGEVLGVSEWFEMDQARIDAFAEVTEDRQFIHLDSDRAALTPFGGTVAHGFLTLSMLSAMSYDALPRLDGATASVNYGFDSIRFISPVRSGARIRARFRLRGLDPRPEGSVMLRNDVTVEIEGQPRPALAAEWRILFLFP